VPATAGTPPEGAVVVTAATGAAAGPTASGVAGTGDEAARPVGGDGAGTAHLAVLAGSNEFSDDLDQWVQALEGAGSMKAGSRE